MSDANEARVPGRPPLLSDPVSMTIRLERADYERLMEISRARMVPGAAIARHLVLRFLATAQKAGTDL